MDYARYHGGQRSKDDIRLIVVHATDGDSFDSSMEWMNREHDVETDKHGLKRIVPVKSKASYHYGLERDGEIVRMLPVTTIAYHAGDSAWPHPAHYPPGNKSSVNPFSVGVAFALKEHEEATEIQLESGIWLCRFWMGDLDIRPSRVPGHYEVSPGRKRDPLSSGIRMEDFRQQLAGAV